MVGYWAAIMKNEKNIIEALLIEGAKFEYGNFATHTVRGYVEQPTADWLAWVARVENIIQATFVTNSAPRTLVDKAGVIKLKGYGKENFQSAKQNLITALQRAAEAIDNDKFNELRKRSEALSPLDLSNKVFIVHGHDDNSKNELEILLRDMGLDPVILHRQIDGGMTIIEKFEANADVGYAFVILTPDEVAYLASEEGTVDADRKKERRARPNVIWEFGYFVGRLGRKRTCCLYNGDVVLPSDLSGLIYKRFHNSVEELGWSIQKELKAIGYKLT